jgi:hypothetical protein
MVSRQELIDELLIQYKGNQTEVIGTLVEYIDVLEKQLNAVIDVLIMEEHYALIDTLRTRAENRKKQQ